MHVYMSVCACVCVCTSVRACLSMCKHTHACTSACASARASRVHAHAHPVCTRGSLCAPAAPPPVGAPHPWLPARAGVPVGRGWERGACVITPVAMETSCSPGAGAAWARVRGRGERGLQPARALARARLPGGSRLRGGVAALLGWLWLGRDGHGSLGTHSSVGMVTDLLGWSQVRGDAQSSMGTVTAPWGLSQLHGTGHGNHSCPHVPPMGWEQPEPSVGARAGGWDRHMWVWGHLEPVPCLTEQASRGTSRGAAVSRHPPSEEEPSLQSKNCLKAQKQCLELKPAPGTTRHAGTW